MRIEIDGIGVLENPVDTDEWLCSWIDRMAVEVDGDGDAVVMVHGLGGTTNTWTPLMPALAGAQRSAHRPAGFGPIAQRARTARQHADGGI